MIKHAIPLVFVALATTLSSAQVTWTVIPGIVPTEQKVGLLVVNQTKTSINLPSCFSHSIRDGGGRVVSAPIGPPTTSFIGPNQSRVYYWDQKSEITRQFVSPGHYEARFAYRDIANQWFEISATFRIIPDRISVSGRPSPGGRMTLIPDSPGAPNHFYRIACALTSTPGLPLRKNRILALTPDALFQVSVLTGPPIFNGFSGVLDTSGKATATIAIPNQAKLKGLQIFVAHVTFRSLPQGGISGYSASRSFVIQ